MTQRMPLCITIILSLLSIVFLASDQRGVLAEECGTRFTDFTSSVVLADVVLQGSVEGFHPAPSSSRLRNANVSMLNVYKGMDILKSSGQMSDGAKHIMIQSFGPESKEDCVASDNESMMRKDMVFFLRQSPDRRMMQHTALPLLAEGNEAQRVKRSLCDTCIRPPKIRRLVCKDCARQPHVKVMKSKKTIMGRKARLRCSARGRPAPTLAWFKNQVPVMSGNGGATIRTTALTSTLIFARTTSAHSGQYTCVATNDVGKAEELVTLEVSRRKQRRRQKQPTASVKDAPDKVVCEANPCMNGGTCYFSPSLNLRQCVCSSGYEGVRCENVLSSATILDNNNNNNNNNNGRGTSETRPTDTASISQTSNHLGTDMEKAKNMAISQTMAKYNQSSRMTKIPITTSRAPPIHANNPAKPQTSNNNVIRTDGNSRSRPVVSPQTNVRSPSRLPQTNARSPSRLPQTNARSPSRLPQTNTRSPFRFPQTNARPASRYSSNGEVLSSHPVRKKSSLKIISCKEKGFCLNKGKCKYVSKLKKMFCQCRKGYGGIRCQLLLF